MDDENATVTVINPELDKTAYNETFVVEEEHSRPPSSLQEKLASIYMYAKEEEVKRELDLGNKEKIIATVDKVKELIPTACKVCGEAVSVSDSRYGAVLIIQWNCANGHVDYWTSSEILIVKNNQKVNVNNVQLSAAIFLSGNNFIKFELLSKFLSLANISETLF